MYITKIVLSKGKRYKVYSDEIFLFALYQNEIKKYHVIENSELDEELISSIKTEIIRKRAKERALYLLEKRPFTSYMIKNKLKESDYPEDVMQEVIIFLEKYGYLDDEAYFHMYLDAYKRKKSKKQIICELITKGIDKEIINHGFESSDYSEQESCYKQLEHYIRGKDIQDKKMKQKVFQYLYRKGFSTGVIKKSLDKYEIL